MVNYSSSEFKERAQQLFDLIGQKKYEIYISNIVLEEIGHNTRIYRNKLEELIKRYKPVVIFQNDETELLAGAYTENAYKSKKVSECLCDAFHAAIATAANISYMVSYNYRNLLNINVLEHINSVNLLAGYNHSLSIYPPFMFLDLNLFQGDKGTVDDHIWQIKADYSKKLISLGKKTSAKKLSYHKTFTNRMLKKMSLQTVNINQKVSYL